MNVITSGIFVSSLLCEQTNSAGDIDGLLVGHATSYTSQSIDDDSMDKTHFQKIYYVDAMIPALHPFEWYNFDGSLNKEGLNNILQKTNKTKVIGWFKSRRQTSMIASFQENLVHTSLEDWSQAFHGPEQQLIFMLVSTQSTTAPGEPGSLGGLLTIDYQMSIKQDSRFINIPSSIKNLGNFAKADYRNISELQSNNNELIFQSTIDKYKHQFCDKNEDIIFANHIESLSKEMTSKFENLAEELKTSELSLQVLSRENDKLRQHLLAMREKRNKNVVSNNDLPEKEALMDLEEEVETCSSSSHQLNNTDSSINSPSNFFNTAYIDEDLISPSPVKKYQSKIKEIHDLKLEQDLVDVTDNGPAEIHSSRETRSKKKKVPTATLR